MEKTVSSKYIFHGDVINLRLDVVSLHGGGRAQREIIEHPGACGVAAVLENKKLLLVRQFRKPFEEFLLEIPAGKLDAGESFEECAARELEEETGYIASELIEIMDFYPSPGCSNEKIKIFRAGGLVKTKKMPDPDEFIQTVEVSMDDAVSYVKSKKIKDGKTIAAILAVLQD